ncbi:Xylosidase/arabinosidase-like protein [Hapsidospora chrysogenum ATCC 11550]|uniref:Endo-1,5-alpha-L-arabinanase A n=1 Tax=Hapsidospora chrysogenum (strain ATCC 11550 / CBS 779.69 / DSM 880 / IAM 14645 / JCM 23072 / IMI 49137) TaxID=857340 RepID=A0A086T6X4_HAPC1|nr:Xylosidase/arabinosidase-like protein [Hapsidospora chrysogenum ATCC 11550]
MRFYTNMVGALLALLAGAYSVSVEQMQDALDAITIHKLDDIRGNIHLPSTTPDGHKISWSSSDANVISNDGQVTRQRANTAVSLTASISSEDGSALERTFDASVRAAIQLDGFEGYAFSYFVDNSIAGEKIYFAASNGNDALSWTELNNGQPVLESTQGTRGLRDPFMIRSPEGDTFYLIATDLSIGSGTSWGDAVRHGSHYLEVWESNDLVNWSEQRHIKVAPSNAGNTWAPEAYYDEELGAYLVFWASSLYAEDDPDHTGESYHRMMYATTRDFVTFGEPVVWQDNGMSRIDSTVLREADVYHRFTKDEGAAGTGCADIIQESSSTLRDTLESWSVVATCIGRDAGTQAVEGPTTFKANPADVNGEKFYLFVDEYVGRGYIPLQTDDIASPDWQVPGSYNLPSSPRHGTVLPVTAAELSALRGQERRNTPRAEQPRDLDERQTEGVLPGYYADPNIAVFDGDCNYYIYATSDGYDGWGGKEFYVWSSPDLASWTRSEEPILVLDGENGTVPWATGNAWAPTIAERDGRYYFYFSGHNPTYDDKTMGVAVADSPLGPFVAHPEPIVTGTEDVATSGGSIDPYVLRDPESGEYYLYWGNGTPVYARLNDDMVSVDWSTAAGQDGLTDYREGSFVNYRDGVYHMTYSIDDTRSEDYRVGYATGPSPHGPWTYRGVVLEKDVEQGLLATGHSSIVNVPGTDEWYIAYHRFAVPDGDGTHREVTIDRVTFDEETGIMERVAPTLGGVEARVIPGCEEGAEGGK